MAARATFATEFDPYRLTGVGVTNRELGHGSYSTVLELEYMGLKCAGKQIHELLLRQGDTSYTVRRFEEECRLLSQVRHPNIVQFLGVYFKAGEHTPILVMEFLPINLTTCIEQYGILPQDISYSILHDVSLGLCYLHNQTPTIIHRDLSSNNVLITSNMTAKISDLGVARMVNLTPLQISRMTQTPGTPAYMPPEVMVSNPIYDTSIDEFSYGILMIHIFSGQWPEPQVGPVLTEPGKMIPISEAERRMVFLQAIGNSHPLMDLILKCIDNYPLARAHANEIVERLARMVVHNSATFANRLEMLRQIGYQEKEKQTLRTENKTQIQMKNELIQQKENRIVCMKNEIDRKVSEIDQLNMAHSIEVEQLRLQIEDLNTQMELLKAKSEAQVTELHSKAETLSDGNAENLLHEREQHELQLSRQRQQDEMQLDDRLAKEEERNKQVCTGNYDNVTLQHTIIKLEAEIVARDNSNVKLAASAKKKDSEIEAMSRALQMKDTTILRMNSQLTKSREYLVTKQQVLQASITWKECAEMPIKFSSGRATVINGKVFCGGGMVDGDLDDAYSVYCYDPQQDNWTTLSSLPVRRFGLGHISGKLVAVGGLRKRDDATTNEILTYDERSRKWKQTIPPMSTSRHSSGVLSLKIALLVAGGDDFCSMYAVEVYKPSTSQWYRTNPLPKACANCSILSIDRTCYLIGGNIGLSLLKQALHASVDDLLHDDAPDSHTHEEGTHPAWSTLANTPAYNPAAAVLGGNLLVIGGKKRGTSNKVYMYSSATNSWVYISDIPAPRSQTTVAVLPSEEILVIGGFDSEEVRVNTLYKGTLHPKM